MQGHEEPRSRIDVSFKKSSSDKGTEGFDVYVGEGADEAEADRLMALALALRDKALEALKPKTFEDAVNSLGAVEK